MAGAGFLAGGFAAGFAFALAGLRVRGLVWVLLAIVGSFGSLGDRGGTAAGC
jgi:hypothetical protein